MRRLILILACVLLWSAPVSAQVWVAVDTSGNSAGGADTTLAGGTALTLSAGDAVFVCTFDYNNIAIDSVTDGTHTYTGLPEASDGTTRVRLFYLLSATGGMFTPTVNYGGSATNRGLYAVSYTHVGVANFETETADSDITGPLNSGNISPTGSSDLLSVACGAGTGQVIGSMEINGTAASGSVNTGAEQLYWDLRNHSSFTGAATATITPDAGWVATIAAFQSEVAGTRKRFVAQPGPGNKR